MPKCLAIAAAAFALCFYCAAGAFAAHLADSPKLVVNIPSRTLTLYAAGKLVKQYPVGIGRPGHQTPTGSFEIISKEINPTWIKPVSAGETPVVIGPGPDNPLGYRWMEFADLYGIHGTNAPSSVGGYVSNGCIRMLESDVEELYELVPLKTPVVITYERIFIGQDENQAVTLSIYPDEYNLAPVSLYDVNQKLRQYRVAGCIDDERLSRALKAADGERIVVGKPFFLTVVGMLLKESGVEQNGARYIPAVPVATALKLAIGWDVATSTLTTAYGSAPGYVRDDILYFKSEDAFKLFELYAFADEGGHNVQLNMYPGEPIPLK